jgi:hypothetical protein
MRISESDELGSEINDREVFDLYDDFEVYHAITRFLNQGRKIPINIMYVELGFANGSRLRLWAGNCTSDMIDILEKAGWATFGNDPNILSAFNKYLEHTRYDGMDVIWYSMHSPNEYEMKQMEIGI